MKKFLLMIGVLALSGCCGTPKVVTHTQMVFISPNLESYVCPPWPSLMKDPSTSTQKDAAQLLIKGKATLETCRASFEAAKDNVKKQAAAAKAAGATVVTDVSQVPEDQTPKE